MINDKLYRLNVGITLFNNDGKVFIGNRISRNMKYTWQMPQGGIDDGEDIEKAVFRELEEETGVTNAEIVKIHKEWLYYDFPADIEPKLFNGRYKGQKQKWVALKFNGNDNEVNLNAHEKPEFDRWKWLDLKDVIDLVVPFKKDLYKNVLHGFKDILT